MNCPHCGTSNFDNASICANCGRPLAAVPPPPPTNTYMPPPPPSPGTGYGSAAGYGAPVPGPRVPNYLLFAVFTTFCCCMPLGIVAIIFGAQVNSKLAVGDYAGATEASRKAKLFCWIAVALGLGGFIIAMVINGAALIPLILESAATR